MRFWNVLGCFEDMEKDPSEIPPHSFFPFWGIAIKKGWNTSEEKLGRFLTWLAIISPVILFGIFQSSKGGSPDAESRREETMNHCLVFAPFGAWLIWFVVHILKAPHEIYKDINDKYKIELAKNKPKFKLSCIKDTEGRPLLIPNTNGAFFRIRVETECVNGIKNCVGNLLKIEKDGVVVFGHDTLKLPFSKAEDPKCLEKTIAQNTPEWLDILIVVLYQPPARNLIEIEIRAHNPHAFAKDDDRDHIGIATKPHSKALDINGNYIFERAGEYILHVNVVGDDAPTATARLKFNWSGYAKTSTIEII